jgi:NADPH:quinone reductase-like Zn-dependent oxidoreductase
LLNPAPRQIGPGVQGFSVGDQVFAMADNAYAELCVINAAVLAKIPKGLDLIRAAALPLATVTGNQFSSATVSKRAKRSVKVVPVFSKFDGKTLEFMAEAVRDGKLVIPISQTLPLSEAAQAQAAAEKGGIGKILLVP